MASLFPSFSSSIFKSNSHRRSSSLIPDRVPTCRSYVQAVIEGSIPNSRNRLRRKNWVFKNRSDICFRCGDRGHHAFQCRDPIRCFACGKTGHMKSSCSMNSISVDSGSQNFVSSLKSKSIDSGPQLIDHGFQFTLKCMLLKRILLDNLWNQRSEGIQLLEELFSHFDVINSPNIGKGYRERFGDPEDYFGKADFSNNNILECVETEDDMWDLKGILNTFSSDHYNKDDFFDFDPMIIDSSVILYNKVPTESESNKATCFSGFTSEVKRNDNDSNCGFTRVKGKRSKSQNIVNFEIKSYNSFNCLAEVDKEFLESGMGNSVVSLGNGFSDNNNASDNQHIFDSSNALGKLLLKDGNSGNSEEVVLSHIDEAIDGLSSLNSVMILDKIIVKDASSNSVGYIDLDSVGLQNDINTLAYLTVGSKKADLIKQSSEVFDEVLDFSSVMKSKLCIEEFQSSSVSPGIYNVSGDPLGFYLNEGVSDNIVLESKFHLRESLDGLLFSLSTVKVDELMEISITSIWDHCIGPEPMHVQFDTSSHVIGDVIELYTLLEIGSPEEVDPFNRETVDVLIILATRNLEEGADMSIDPIADKGIVLSKGQNLVDYASGFIY